MTRPTHRQLLAANCAAFDSHRCAGCCATRAQPHDRQRRPACAAAVPQHRHEHGCRQLREQPLPRLGGADQGFERPADRIRDLVARRQARARVQGAVQRAVAAHRAATSGLRQAHPRRRSASTATRTTCPRSARGERFQLDDGVSCEACHGPSGRWLESHVQDGATHEDNLKAGLYPTAEPVRARAAVPVVPLRQRRPLRHAPADGRGPSADGVRARHVHRGRAGALQGRRRLGEAQADVGRRAGLGDRPGAGRLGDDGRADRPEARPRRPLPGTRAVRLPRLPPPDERQALDAAHAGPGAGRGAAQRFEHADGAADRHASSTRRSARASRRR